LDRFGNHMGEYFGDEERDHRRPKRLAADPAVKAIEEIGPIHRKCRDFDLRPSETIATLGS
jgi:hypothetical protein